jgi:hypothetical protein
LTIEPLAGTESGCFVMATLKDFIAEHGIDPHQIATASSRIEAKRPHEQARLLARAAARRSKKSYADAGAEKPERMGHGISARIVAGAVGGQAVSRKNRQKIARALESLLSEKGIEVDGTQLFADAPKKKPKNK